MSDPRPPKGNPDMSQNKLFLHGREYFFLRCVFPDQERKIPGNPETPEVFPVTKTLISDILDSLLGGITN